MQTTNHLLRTTLALISLAIAQAGWTAVELARDGQSAYRIVIATQAIPAERYAAEELQRYLEKISDANLAIITDDAPAGEREIILGATNARLTTPGLKPDTARLGTDGFMLKTSGRHLIVAGGRPRGTLYGVYALLEEKLGVRWWTPEAEFVPKLALVAVPELDEVQLPAFEYREVFWTEMMRTNADFAARHRLNGCQTEFADRHGGRPVIYHPFVHSLDELIPRSLYQEHPDYFPLVGTRRRSGYTQRCLSNPEVVKLAIATVRKWIKEHPEATIISVSQNDTEGYCRCPTCSALDKAEGSPAASLLQFVNTIAADIERDFPGIMVDTLAYQYTRKPPKTIRPRPNVIIRLCSIECCFAHPLDGCSREANRRFVADLLAWQKIAPRMYVWDYTTNFSHYQQPFPNFDVLQANIRFFATHGVTGLFEQGNYSMGGQGEMEPLRAYLLAKLIWNPSADVERHTREFLEGYYGKTAAELRAYLDLLQGQVRNKDCHAYIFDEVPTWGNQILEVLGTGFVAQCYNSTARYLTPKFLTKADRLLAKAEDAAESDSVRFRVQVARIPVWYAMLAAKQVDGQARKVLLARFVQTLRRANISNLSENRPLDKELKGLGWQEPGQ